MEQVKLEDVLLKIAGAKHLNEFEIAKLQVHICKLLNDEYIKGIEKGIELRSTGE